MLATLVLLGWLDWSIMLLVKTVFICGSHFFHAVLSAAGDPLLTIGPS